MSDQIARDSMAEHCAQETSRKPHHCVTPPVYWVETPDGDGWPVCHRHLISYIDSGIAHEGGFVKVKPLDPKDDYWRMRGLRP